MGSLPFLRATTGAFALGLLAATAACGSAGDAATAGSDDDLTSVTARSRTLEFVGTVYLAPGASDAAILSAVRAQAQTAFGPLRTSDMAVNSRELKDIDTGTFVKRDVRVVDTDGKPRDMTEVTYTYRDDAVVGLSLAERSAVPLALLNPSYKSQTDRLIRECTRDDDEAHEFRASAWYVFEPSLAKCQTAIHAEQEKVDADRAALADPANELAASEVDRLYLPITVKLGADRTNRGDSYPEYARLYRGGAEKDKLVVSLVYGLIDHGKAAGPSDDYNWSELMTNLAELIDAQGDGFRVVAGPDDVDLESFELSTGRKVDHPAFSDLVNVTNVEHGISSLKLDYQEKKELEAEFAKRIYRKWVAIEKPLRVAVGEEAPRDFGLKILVYFGADSDSRPHKYATKNSDVFLYNGHSYIGFGPLDPKNFSEDDFAQSYQILWIDGCVSYNYYEKDYIPLKQRGTKDLDLITNGIEAPSWRSGHAMGQFLITLLDGNSHSYKDLLLAARDTDPLRVVDGELDNEFRPAATRISITER